MLSLAPQGIPVRWSLYRLLSLSANEVLGSLDRDVERMTFSSPTSAEIRYQLSSFLFLPRRSSPCCIPSPNFFFQPF